MFYCVQTCIDESGLNSQHILEQLDMDSLRGNSTHTMTALSNNEFLDNHKSILQSDGIILTDKGMDLLRCNVFIIPQCLPQ